MGQPSLGIDAVQLDGLDQGVCDGRGAPVGGRVNEQIFRPPERDRTHRPFSRVVVKLQNSVIKIRVYLRYVDKETAPYLPSLSKR